MGFNKVAIFSHNNSDGLEHKINAFLEVLEDFSANFDINAIKFQDNGVACFAMIPYNTGIDKAEILAQYIVKLGSSKK